MKNRTARLGIVMLDQKEGRYPAARDGLNLLIQDSPHDTALLKMRANLELEQNRPDIALIDIEQILTIDPSDAEAYVMKGDIHLTQKKKDEAQKAYEQAIAHGIPRPELNDRLLQCR